VYNVEEQKKLDTRKTLENGDESPPDSADFVRHCEMFAGSSGSVHLRR
jgi:hypothetical protein